MNAKVFVLQHDSRGLRKGLGSEESLIEIQSGRGQAGSQLQLIAVPGDGQTLYRADVYAGVAFDTARSGEHGLDIAVQTTFDLARRLLGGEPQLDFDVQFLEPLHEVDVLHFLAGYRVVVVVIAPLADAHFLAYEVHAVRRSLGDRNTLAIVMNGDGGLMAM